MHLVNFHIRLVTITIRIDEVESHFISKKWMSSNNTETRSVRGGKKVHCRETDDLDSTNAQNWYLLPRSNVL